MKIYITVYMWGDNLIPERLTEIFGVLPARSFTKGQRRSSPSSDAVSFTKTGLWVFDIDGFTDGNKISEHISYLEKVFSNGIIQLREEKIVEKVRISIMAQSENETEESWEAEILPEDLERVAKMGASIYVTVLWQN